jgi:hypothetical protein
LDLEWTKFFFIALFLNLLLKILIANHHQLVLIIFELQQIHLHQVSKMHLLYY